MAEKNDFWSDADVGVQILRVTLGVFTRLSAASIVGTLLVVLYVAAFPLMAMGSHESGNWLLD